MCESDTAAEGSASDCIAMPHHTRPVVSVDNSEHLNDGCMSWLQRLLLVAIGSVGAVCV